MVSDDPEHGVAAKDPAAHTVHAIGKVGVGFVCEAHGDVFSHQRDTDKEQGIPRLTSSQLTFTASGFRIGKEVGFAVVLCYALA